MSRTHRSWLLLPAVTVLTLFFSARGPQSAADEKKEAPAEKWRDDRSLEISPAAAPVPALKYRLFPRTTDRKEGNAVPIYLRITHERSEAWRKQLFDKPDQWKSLSLERLPLDEVKKFLEGNRRVLRELELGARRKTADWNYALDAGPLFDILLPDISQMRLYAALLHLQARAKIAESRNDEAIHALETGFSFCQQLGEGPFFINVMVGQVTAESFEGGVLDLIARADAPNLYWALAVLPRPFIDSRKAIELQQQFLELSIPAMADLHRPRSPAEWDAVLKRVREQYGMFGAGTNEPVPTAKPTDPAGKSPDLARARKYLAEVVRLPEDRLKSMCPAETLLLYLSHYYHDVNDNFCKTAYVPFQQALPLLAATEKRFAADPDTEAKRLTRLLMGGERQLRLNEARFARKLAAMQVIEALRMHAAAHDGRLPDTLDQVSIVPIPLDPGTGKAFEYRRDGRTATIVSRIPGEPLEKTGLRYRVTMRK